MVLALSLHSLGMQIGSTLPSFQAVSTTDLVDLREETDKRGYSDCQAYGYTDEYETACMNTYDPTNLIFTNYTVGNPIDRQWNWMLCNEPFAYWQE